MLLFCRLALLIRSFCFAILRYTMAALDAIELAAESEVAADIEGFSPASICFVVCVRELREVHNMDPECCVSNVFCKHAIAHCMPVGQSRMKNKQP